MATPPSTDHNARSLYVGNVDPSVTDIALQAAFDSEDTKVVKVKLFKNRTPGATSEFGFVEFTDHESAEKALQRSASGMKLAGKELKVNWANSSPSHSNHTGPNQHHNNHSGPRDHHNAGKVGANGLYNVFVGDLDGTVDDAGLKQAFVAYASLEEVKVMVDLETGTSRGFGFAMFKERQDAQNAIVEMQGRALGGRNLRLNWAHPPSGPGHARMGVSSGDREGGSGGYRGEGGMRGERKMGMHHHGGSGGVGGIGSGSGSGMAVSGPLDYNEVVAQSPASNVTVYVGNLASDVTSALLQELFAPYGEISEVRDHTDSSRVVNGEPQHRGYGFILFKNHESAARAIVALNGRIVNGKAIKCSWGNEKRPIQNTTGALLPGFPYGGGPFPNGFPSPNGFTSNPMYFYQYPYSMQPAHPQGAMPQGLPANLPPGQAPAPFNAMAWAPWSPNQGSWPQNPQLMPMPFPTAGLAAPSQPASAAIGSTGGSIGPPGGSSLVTHLNSVSLGVPSPLSSNTNPAAPPGLNTNPSVHSQASPNGASNAFGALP